MFFLLVTLFGNTIPSAALSRQPLSPVANVPAALPVAYSPTVSMVTPPDAGSRGLPASKAADFQAQYESEQRLNGVFDGEFATPGASSYVEPQPFHLTNPGYSTRKIPIPAGDYDSVEVDVWAKSYSEYRGIAGSIEVSPRDLVPNEQARGTIYSVGGNEAYPNGASGSHRFTLVWAAPPQTPLDLLLICDQDNTRGGDCIFSNIRFFRKAPGWRLGTSQTTIKLSDEVYTGVYADIYKGLAPKHGPFLGIETTHVDGGGAFGTRFP